MERQKTGGRKPGTRNKASNNIDKEIDKLIDIYFPKAEGDMEKATPGERLAFVGKLVEIKNLRKPEPDCNCENLIKLNKT